MKFEIEILDKDLEDRAIIIGLRSLIEEKIQNLSDFSKNNLVKELNGLRGNIEWVENAWLKWQRERALNKLSEVLNVDRQRLGDRQWYDD